MMRRDPDPSRFSFPPERALSLLGWAAGGGGEFVLGDEPLVNARNELKNFFRLPKELEQPFWLDVRISLRRLIPSITF